MMVHVTEDEIEKGKNHSSLFGPTPIPAKIWVVVSTTKSIAKSSMSSVTIILAIMFLIKDHLMECEIMRS